MLQFVLFLLAIWVVLAVIGFVVHALLWLAVAAICLFSNDAWFGLIITGLVIGAVWGALFGYLGHAALRGQRDFASTQALVATRYDVVARDGQAEAARAAMRKAGLHPVDGAAITL